MIAPKPHSVTLDEERCKGCTNCIKRCPTEAIRVRKGKARIKAERCIDCGECIRTCPYHAKKAVLDGLPALADYDYRIALPAPALYGQFPEHYGVADILGALLAIGFDEVVEVAQAADLAARGAREAVAARTDSPRAGPFPLISSSCPAVLRLARISFPSLLDKFLPILPPVEIAARMARDAGALPKPPGKRVGIFFISPCPAKMSAVREPLGYGESAVAGVLSIKDVYLPLREALRSGAARPLAPRATGRGLAWARTEGESESIGARRSLSVDGIAQVIEVFEAVESGRIRDVDFIEAMACPGGCVGGPLTVENPYVAKGRIANRATAAAPAATTRPAAPAPAPPPASALGWTEALRAVQALQLHEDLMRALIMLEELEQTRASLPGLDCGSCGAPSCKALAEDIVKGEASATDCVFKLREKIRLLAGEMLALENIQPPGLDKD